jgi:hypothetical protein
MLDPKKTGIMTIDGRTTKPHVRVRWCLAAGTTAIAIGLLACTTEVVTEGASGPAKTPTSDAGKKGDTGTNDPGPSTNDGGNDPTPPVEELVCEGTEPPATPPACSDTDATCKSSCGSSWKPPRMCKPAKPKTACTDAQIEALATACAKEPGSAGCQSARTAAENKDCGTCIFGTKTEPWKAILLQPGSVPDAKYNQAGCIDLAGGVPDCGKKYFTVTSCFDAYCSDCTGTEETSCQKDVAQGTGECKTYLIDQACATALDTAEKTCFPFEQTDAAIATLFKNMAKLFCKP